MISSQHTKWVARTAAILTNGAVASNVFPVGNTLDGRIGVHINFTIGSLTNGLFQAQVSDDGGATWRDCTDPGVLTLTATGNKFFVVDATGAKQFRVTVTGTGTVTSSSAAITFGWQGAGGALG